MQKRSDLEPQIITEWLKRPPGRRTENDVLFFYNVLVETRPDLLSFRSAADKYKVLFSILRNFIER